MGSRRIKLSTIAFIFLVFILVLWFINAVFSRLTNVYNFNTPEIQVMYENVEGYSKYNNSILNISLLYPEDWVVFVDGTDEFKIGDDISTFEDNINYIEVYNITKDNLEFSEKDFNFFTKWFIRKTVESDSKEFSNTRIEQFKTISGFDVIQEYTYHYVNGFEEEELFSLKYFVLLEDDEVVVIHIKVDNKEELEVIAGSLKF